MFKSEKKIIQLTNNPITLLFGVNHVYLSRFFTFFGRMLISIVVIIFTIVGLTANPSEALIPLFFIYIIYLIIDKLRIKKHLKAYNQRFENAINLMRDKKFFKAFKQFVKFGLKDSMLYILENEPTLLKDTLMSNLTSNDIEKINVIVENRDVEALISIIKRKVISKRILDI